MRILLSCLQSPVDYPIPAYRFWREYFRNGLAEAGHTVIEVDDADWARGLMPLDPGEHDRWREATWGATLSLVRREKQRHGVDMFLSYLYPSQIDASAIRTIRDLGVPCVNFFCDNVRNYRRLPNAFDAFDLHWVPEFKAQALYRARGWKFVHAPMPCWVEPARRALPAREQPVVSFIGGCDALRAELLARAARHNLPLEIRGANWSYDATTATPSLESSVRRIAGWREFLASQGMAAAVRRLKSCRVVPSAPFDFSPYLHSMPTQDEYSRIIAESAVSLGINRYPSFRHPVARPGTYSRLRDIEAPMLGACYLTEWTTGLDMLYDLDTEIAVYRSADELCEQADALLADPVRRQKMRIASQRRALREHTIGQSLARIVSCL